MLCNRKKRGYARAIKTGIDHSTGDILVIIDADDTYEASAINQLITPLLKDEADVCLATRRRETFAWIYAEHEPVLKPNVHINVQHNIWTKCY